MELRITLAPDGGLRLILPAGRALDVGNGASAMHYIQRILKDANSGLREQRGYIGEFPTQHIIDIWQKQDEATRMEDRADREAAQAEALKAELVEKGINLEALDFRL